jgi:hypothetical protein
MRVRIVWCLVGLLLSARSLEARVVRFVVETTTPFASGHSYESAGPFVKLTGTVSLEVDPRDPLNAVIVNLDKAPRNARGMVEFSAPFIIIKPLDMRRGNQKIFYGVNNRGNSIEIDRQSYPSIGGESLDAGDGLIFRLGYTYVDAGWAGDVVTKGERLGARLPIAMNLDGSAIVATIRIEYTATKGYTLPLKGNDRFVSYEAADTNETKSTLTVREGIAGKRQTVPSDRWAFGRCPTGRESLTKTTFDICVFDGFKPNHFYELMYPAKNPWVMGLGYAVTRDVASFLRYATKDSVGNPNPLAASDQSVGIRRAYGIATSSTGMYMRDYLYLGFNEDESHRKVFDAVRIGVPGTHRLMANLEFADPNIYSGQDQHQDFPSFSYPPLTYAVTTDPISGIRDGILKRPATDPLVMEIDSGNEFWNMNASLNVHDGRGKPISIPANVRLYFLANHAHVGASGVAVIPKSKGNCDNLTNGATTSKAPVQRALLVALDEWADKAIAPPPSVYPSVDRGTLVSVEDAAKVFPAIPGVRYPQGANQLFLLDYGPGFNSKGGRLTTLPPVHGAAYQVRVPKPGPDGVDMDGIRTVDIVAPVGTSLSWNLRAGTNATELCGLTGSFIPFAKTKVDREAAHDPRPSLEERYTDHAGFVKAVQDATRTMIKDRFLLDEDAQKMIKIAEESAILR